MAEHAPAAGEQLRPEDAQRLRQVATRIAREAATTFISARTRATVDVVKSDGGFATTVDLEIERFLRAELASTGLDVCGEEYGGVGQGTWWVVDPIDGTTNYATGNPHCAILIALIHNGAPVVAVAAMPLLGTMISTSIGAPGLVVEGVGLSDPEHPTIGSYSPTPTRPQPCEDASLVGFGSIVSPVDSRFPTQLRQQLLQRLAVTYPRLRITGSVGVDLALTALGVFEGAVTFSPHPWDNAAGVLLVQAAGRTVTDLTGRPWVADAGMGVVAGSEELQGEILRHIRQVAEDHQPRGEH